MEPHARRMRVTMLARELVSALERHAELRRAHDRLGDRLYLDARARLVEALVAFAREVALAARDRR